jgi:hypothetical protein
MQLGLTKLRNAIASKIADGTFLNATLLTWNDFDFIEEGKPYSGEIKAFVPTENGTEIKYFLASANDEEVYSFTEILNYQN